MAEYYDEIADGYEELHKEEQLKKIQAIQQFVHVKKSDKLLDVGCGTGISTEQWDCIRFGVDPSAKLIEMGKKLRKGIQFVIGNAENLPFPDRSFDFVISITAIQNFKDIEKGISEMKRVGRNCYVFSFLKNSPKRNAIEKAIRKHFRIHHLIEQDKDIIFIA